MPPPIATAPPLGPLLSKPKIFFVTVMFGVLVRAHRLFGFTTGALMAFLVLWFPSLIYMTYTLPCEMSSPTTVNTLRLSTLLSRSQLQIPSTTPASDLMRESTTLSFGIITSMVPIQQKADTLGSSVIRIPILILQLLCLGLGYGD